MVDLTHKFVMSSPLPILYLHLKSRLIWLLTVNFIVGWMYLHHIYDSRFSCKVMLIFSFKSVINKIAYGGANVVPIAVPCTCLDGFCVCLFFGGYFLFVFCSVILLFSSGWKRWNQFYHYNISGRGKIISYNGLKQVGLISLQWNLKSETCQGISD